MKKIPTLFKREYANHRVVAIKDEITPGCEDALLHGKATIKWDGACCAVIDGVFYKRYDAKNGKKPPAGAIPCCEPDPVTGHWPHWVKVDKDNPADKHFISAFRNTAAPFGGRLEDATYEACGPHFQTNPYELEIDFLFKHGRREVELERSFEGIKQYLTDHAVEGVVFWLDGEPVCKIKRSDFGFEWPVSGWDIG